MRQQRREIYVRDEGGYGILPSSWFVSETSETCAIRGTVKKF
jgi:hypothetical protein